MLFRNKLFFYLPALALVFGAFLLGSRVSYFKFGEISSTKPVPLVNAQAEAGTKEKFDYLSEQRSSSCGLQRETVLSYGDDIHIQGSCCSAMDLHRYQEQVEGLEKYSEYSVIPQDPYDIPVTLAKELFDFQENIVLTADQQTIYDEAMNMSQEGGPCCCKCWRWTAFEGQAKYLITQHNWTSEQIAQLWDIEDGCGGEGHEGHG